MLYRLKDLQSRAATAENPTAAKGAGGQAGGGRKGAPCIENFAPHSTITLLDADGPGLIRHIWCTLPPGDPAALRGVILRCYWDLQEQPSVEVPLGDFFGLAHGVGVEMVSAAVAAQGGKGLNCWLPMPFRRHGRITVTNESERPVRLFFYQVDFTLGDEIGPDDGYFHAQFRRQNPCPLGEDYAILDGVRGRGVYVGTVLGVRSLYRGAWWGEGELKFYLDGDREYPTICGTGTEDYAGCAWGLQPVLTPHQGAPLVDNARGYYSLYRFHTLDPIYFQGEIKVTVQQIGYGESQAAGRHYGERFRRYRAAGSPLDSPHAYFEREDDWSSVAYWYQSLPTAEFPALPSFAERARDLPVDAPQAKRDDQG